MGKKNEKEKDNKKKLNRQSLKDTKKKEKGKTKSSKKSSEKKSNKKFRKESVEEESDNEFDILEDLVLPGQKNPTPPAGDATRAFYESLLEQKPNSLMAMKYCVEYGCLDADKAKEVNKILETNKKKSK